MITENLSTLKIHKLTQSQYDRELSNNNLDENALYLTPDDSVSKDEFNSHTTDKNIHITSEERENWNNAEENQNAFSYVAVGDTYVEANSATDIISFSQGDNITLDVDENNNNITVSVPDGSTEQKGVVLLSDEHTSDSSETAATSYALNQVFNIAESANELVAELSDTKADVEHTHDGYMTTFNPTGIGSFSMNRKSETTIGSYSHAEGLNTTASNEGSHAEGYNTTASGLHSHAEGVDTTASGSQSHAEGNRTNATGLGSHAEGYLTEALNDYSHAEGYFTTSSGIASHSEAMWTVASGDYSHAEGHLTEALGECSHAEGYYTRANAFQHASGKYNVEKTSPTSSETQDSSNSDAIFIVGCGTENTRKNAFRISSGGKCFGSVAFGASGADFAELFEWVDGNPNNEDRRGLFVTLDGDKIKLANTDDDYIGVISGDQAFIGNSASEEWQGKYLTDVFGSKISQEVEIPEKIDEITGKVITPAHTAIQYVVNPDYNPDEKYIMRENRKEWGTVGLLGQIVVIDDGTCTVGGYVKPSANGVGTASDNGYRVMKRIDENHIKVLVK